MLAAKGSDFLFINCDGSPSARALAFEILDEYMFMTFAVSKKKMKEVKAASTVKRYSRTLIALHQDRGIDLSFLTDRVNRTAKGLTKLRVDIWGVRKKAKKSPISPAMLLRLGELALEHCAEVGPVVRRANFFAWEGHFRGGTVTVAAEIVTNGWWNPHWHLTRGNIVFHNKADSSIIPPLQPFLSAFWHRKDWYITCEASASIGLQVRKKFGRRFFSGKVTKALPPTEEDEEWLWQIQYEDGDTEQLDYEELCKVAAKK